MDSKLKKNKNEITVGDVGSWLVVEIAKVGRKGPNSGGENDKFLVVCAGILGQEMPCSGAGNE